MQSDGMDIEEKNGLLPLEHEEPVSVRDHKAFALKHMQDLGYDVEDFKVYTWKLTKWRSLDRRLTSPEFECGGHRWRILLFPFGNVNASTIDTVSIYLDYANPKGSPEGWHACAQFALVLSNIHDPTCFISSHAHHRFVAEECDWGFTRFCELKKLHQVQENLGHTRPILEDDSAEITAFVRVLRDETGVLWHNFINYDSKKETGMVGLKNQGATCYMNSLLQSLFFTNYFRKAVYKIPTDHDHATESVALAMQRVFYLLQTSDQPVGTTELTKSFGWKSLDSFMQHDVQEFNRVLQDNLETKMKGTAAEGAISKLFTGKMKSYIKCVDVDYESSRTEEFYDIQLNVKGLRDLHDSFRDYVAVETLDGENKYMAEGYGLQDAKKGVIFQSFPPVLHLQLKRFEYDIQRDAMVKINDRHEFPLDIDLADFVESDCRGTDSWNYKLHGVLVHSGDLHGGHYFALIKPEKDGKWFKFDDDRVTRATTREVLEENYGGEIQNGYMSPTPRNNGIKNKRMTNAYMLVYIRETAIDEVLAPFTEIDTPPHLKARLEEERMASELKRREREEQHLFLTAKVITDESFRLHEGFDLASFEERNWPPSDLETFRVLKQETYARFKERVAKHFHYNPQDIRLWQLVNRQNKTVRPDVPIQEHESNLTMEMVRTNSASRNAELRLYLDYFPNAEKTRLTDQGNAPIMVFLKSFDVANQQLLGIGKHFVQRHQKVGDLVSYINEIMHFPPGTPLRLYEEIKPGMIELMKPKNTFAQSEIQDGDIICFQVEISEKDARDLEEQGKHPNPIAHYDFLQNRVMIFFKPKVEDNDPHSTFQLVFSKKQHYETMAQKVGDHLRWDPIKLRFTTTNTSNGAPKNVLKRSLNQTIAEIIQPSYLTPQSTILYYERLDVSIVELETKRSLKVVWTGLHNKEEGTHSFLLPKTNSVADLADNLAKMVNLSPQGSGRIRIFDISRDGKMQREYSSSDMLGNLPEMNEIYAEEIPVDEYTTDEKDKTIHVFHFTKEPARFHGVPFRFVLKSGEEFSETKKRLQARLALSDKDIAKYRFALVSSAMFKQPTYIADEDVIYDHKFQDGDVLGLDHIDRTGKTRIGLGEKAIVIKG
ncbi:ubiquitin carboxyl-terminal hydrolase 5 [Dacryopinax primogenitus]|uniref:ubiquitinyl hydrolase 1 n=1 Tax=Dacryopinax primogenitus (strain DJM 731) TaxID=1858805 RepID=M5GEG3_DACPD|nr:ubiquitin carboxyl-terminal hydrolase 5 [Dacryopinax primogenitus]EJU05407.1 ubiquitin carboxyl-terminal hydrolase 5 [Dacryopinax primogenitus]